MAENDLFSAGCKQLGQLSGEMQFPFCRCVRHLHFLLVGRGQQGVEIGWIGPAFIIEPHDPQMAEAEPGRFQRP